MQIKLVRIKFVPSPYVAGVVHGMSTNQHIDTGDEAAVPQLRLFLHGQVDKHLILLQRHKHLC